MGAFLEMMKFAIVLSAAIALSACGSKNRQSNGMQALVKDQMQTMIAKRQGKGATAPAPITRESIAGVKAPLAMIRVPSIGYKSLAKQVSKNNGYANFYTSDNKSFVFKNGNLTATRGLRHDLMSRDLGLGPRGYRYLNAEGGIGRITKDCKVTFRGADKVTILKRAYNLTLTEEICYGDVTDVKTRIWRDGKGKAWKAQQWVGPQAGFVTVEWLN